MKQRILFSNPLSWLRRQFPRGGNPAIGIAQREREIHKRANILNAARPALIYGRAGVLYTVVPYTVTAEGMAAHKRRRGRPVFAGCVGL